MAEKGRFSPPDFASFMYYIAAYYTLHNLYAHNALQIVIHIFHMVFHTPFFLLLQHIFSYSPFFYNSANCYFLTYESSRILFT